jgi:hypothetical protein
LRVDGSKKGKENKKWQKGLRVFVLFALFASRKAG